jgi:hypothetical protein
MRFFYFIAILFSLASLAAIPAHGEVAVASGGRVKLTSLGAFDQVCHSLGPMTVGVIEQPHAGTILVDRVNDYPNFPAFNTRSRCNTMKLPETRISYQSTAGYIGQDETLIEIIGPMGRVLRYRFIISVRAGIISPMPQEPKATLHTSHWRRVAKTRAHVTAESASIHTRRPSTPAAQKKPKQDGQPINI